MPPTRDDRTEAHRLLAYIADLELEVDRLRKRDEYLRHEAREAARRVRAAATAGGPWADARAAADDLAGAVRDLHDPSGYHPAHDQVVAVAVRPLAEQVFRWQQRLTGNTAVELQLDLDPDHLEWFPGRLRHLLDNLLSNALRFRDPVKPAPWVRVTVRADGPAYQVRVADNGLGLPPGAERAAGPLGRGAVSRVDGVAVGLAVVRGLVEQSGGELTVRGQDGGGTEVALTLPRYDLDDYLL